MVISQVLERHPVLPVVTPHSVAATVQLAESLFEAGVAVIEIALRTSVAIEAIRAVSDQVPAIMVGAGDG